MNRFNRSIAPYFKDIYELEDIYHSTKDITILDSVRILIPDLVIRYEELFWYDNITSELGRAKYPNLRRILGEDILIYPEHFTDQYAQAIAQYKYLESCTFRIIEDKTKLGQMNTNLMNSFSLFIHNLVIKQGISIRGYLDMSSRYYFRMDSVGVIFFQADGSRYYLNSNMFTHDPLLGQLANIQLGDTRSVLYPSGLSPILFGTSLISIAPELMRTSLVIRSSSALARIDNIDPLLCLVLLDMLQNNEIIWDRSLYLKYAKGDITDVPLEPFFTMTALIRIFSERKITWYLDGLLFRMKNGINMTDTEYDSILYKYLMCKSGFIPISLLREFIENTSRMVYGVINTLYYRIHKEQENIYKVSEQYGLNLSKVGYIIYGGDNDEQRTQLLSVAFSNEIFGMDIDLYIRGKFVLKCHGSINYDPSWIDRDKLTTMLEEIS